MIRSTKHYLNNSNTEKKMVISSFLKQYRIAVQQFIDYIWNNTFTDHKNNIIWDIKSDQLHLPKYIKYDLINNKTLSARALSSAMTQAIGIVKGRIALRKKDLFTIECRKKENLNVDYWSKRLSDKPLTKPVISDKLQAELNSTTVEFKESNKHFNLFVKLSSTGFKIIKFPISHHKCDKKWLKSGGKRLSGVLLSENCIQLRYEIPDVAKKTVGKTVGADTGLKTVLTLSNGDKTPDIDIHNHSLESICKKISRKKKGSKAFKRAQNHRSNFVNWSINQLNFSSIAKVNLEKIINIKHGKSTSKTLTAWSNPLIYNKIVRVLDEGGVRLNLQSSAYRSQRCSGCGIVRKLNRVGKIYTCNNCHLNLDSDLNAALNHEINLPEILFSDHQYLSGKTFFWKEEGLFDISGQELTVPVTRKS